MPGYLTKLVKRLSADEMRRDIHFGQASGRGDFRDWTVGPMFTFWVGGALIAALAAGLLQFAGSGRWRLSGPAWFAISMFFSPLAILFLLGRAIGQYREYRKTQNIGPADARNNV
jgi:hypothetical protein